MIDSSEILNLPPPPADHRIPYGQLDFQFGDLRLPKKGDGFGLVVVIHGGYWRSRYGLEHSGHLCAAITALGYATWSLEYRRLGNMGGGYPGTFHDVAAGLNYARTLAKDFPINLERVGLVGHSAGGQLACWLGGVHNIPVQNEIRPSDILPIRGIVSLAGVLDLRRASELRLSSGVTNEFMGGSPSEFPGRYSSASPLELLPIGCRLMLLHGTGDVNVPFEISKSFFEKAKAVGDDVSFTSLKDVGHFELIDPRSPVWSTVENAIHLVLS